MNRPIDPDLDDRPKVHHMNVELLRREVVRLSREFAEERTENRRLREQRLLLAKLASKKPQFFNPLVAMEAETLRDRILSENDQIRQPSCPECQGMGWVPSKSSWGDPTDPCPSCEGGFKR